MATINKKLSFVAIAIFLIIGFFLINHDYVNKYVLIGGQKIKVDLVDTPETRAKGLSGRPSLFEDTGMLFVFDKPDKYAFWMKDMNFPIDIIWISGDQRIVFIKKDARPELYPEAYAPDMDAMYVLEVPAGFAEKYDLKFGDRVVFEY